MSEQTYTWVINFIIAGLVIGILGMIQPFSLALFKPGFTVLAYSTLAYIVFSHITPKS